MHELEQLNRAVFVYKNISLFGTAGHTLLTKLQALITGTSLLDELEQPAPRPTNRNIYLPIIIHYTSSMKRFCILLPMPCTTIKW